ASSQERICCIRSNSGCARRSFGTRGLYKGLALRSLATRQFSRQIGGSLAEGSPGCCSRQLHSRTSSTALYSVLYACRQARTCVYIRTATCSSLAERQSDRQCSFLGNPEHNTLTDCVSGTIEQMRRI